MISSHLNTDMTRPLQISIVSTMSGFPWGGSEELWAAAALAAANAGFHVQAFVRYDASDQCERIGQLRSAGVKLLPQQRQPAVPKRRGVLERVRGRLSQRKPEPPRDFKSDILDGRPDVILVNLASSACLMTDHKLAQWLVSSDVQYVLLFQFVPESPDDFHVQESSITKECLRKARALCFVADRNRENLSRWTNTNLHNSVVLNNPVKLQTPESTTLPDLETIRFASVARLHVAYKAQDLLLEVFAQPQWRERKFLLTLFGSGPDRTFLEQSIERLNLKGKVTLAGHSSDLQQVWRSQHVLLMPSRGEGTPLSLLEAMACGRTAVVTNVGGMAEWIEDSQNGWVCNGPDFKSWEATMERMWKHRDRLQEFGVNCRKRIAEQLDVSPGSTLLDLLTKAANRPTHS